MARARLRTVRTGVLELTTIVAGVLLALAADRWIERRDAHEMEAAYLARLAEDVRADSAALTADAAGSERRIAWNARLQGMLAGESSEVPDPKGFLRGVITYSVWVPYELRRETWDELVSTGRLLLIRDLTLRHRLGEYYADGERRITGGQQMDRELAGFKLLIEQVVEPETRLVLYKSSPSDERAGISQTEVDRVLERIRADRAVRSALASAEERHRNIVRSDLNAVNSASSLLAILRAGAF